MGVSWVIVRGFQPSDQREIENLLSFFSADTDFAQNILNQTPLEFSDLVPNSLFFKYSIPSSVFDKSLDVYAEDRGSIIMGPGYLLLFAETGSGFFDEVQEALVNEKTRAQNYGVDYLLYLLLFAALYQMDQLISVELHDRFEELEDEIFDNPGKKDSLQKLLADRELVKALYKPLARIELFLASIREADDGIITPQTSHLFTENLANDLETIEKGHERLTNWISEMRQIHELYVNERTNYMLQILSTIFLPLSFLTGLFGMNFVNMPGLQHPYGYYAALGLMLAIVVGMTIYFKRIGRM